MDKRFDLIFDALTHSNGSEYQRSEYRTYENHSFKSISRLVDGMNHWIVVLDKTSNSLWTNGISMNEFFRLESNHE